MSTADKSSDNQLLDSRLEQKRMRAPFWQRMRGSAQSLGRKIQTDRRYQFAIAAMVALLCLMAAAPYIWLHFNKLPDIASLETLTPIQTVNIYDGKDKLVASVSGSEDRRPITLDNVSPEMQKAMVGAEDHEFFSHGGINPSSILRALIVNLQAGHIVEGGSTITQQLVKNLFFPGEHRTINRKIKEFFLANQVDHKYPKKRILEMYLNQIYFGNQAYGIESAAQRYFTKPASKLTLGESAFLAGLVKSPSRLSNPSNRDQAFARQRQVLDQMLGYGMISAAQASTARMQKLAFRKYVNPYQKFPFYISYVMDELRQRFGDQELQHGLNVYTYLDPTAQAQAEKAINDGIAHAPAGVRQGALVSLKVNDAGVIALVGGAGAYENHQWNRAVSPHTMGSSFKPFVYLTGFMKGLTPDSIVQDTAFSVPSGGQSYSPRNFDNTFKGPMTIKQALTLSRNVCAVRIAWFCGINDVINTAHLAGITSRLDPYLPTAIGACAASPLEMAGAYGTFARGGVFLTPHLVRRINDAGGKTIYTYDEKPRKVFDSGSIAQLVDCMQNVVNKGTGLYAQLPGRPVAGKTGTADKSRDIWFIGFTPDTCTAVWGGNDTNQPIANRSVTGGMVMAGMWKKYMVAYYSTHPTPVGTFMVPAKSDAQIADVDGAAAKGISGSLAEADKAAAEKTAEALKEDQQEDLANENSEDKTANQPDQAGNNEQAQADQREGKLIARKDEGKAGEVEMNQPTTPRLEPAWEGVDEAAVAPRRYPGVEPVVVGPPSGMPMTERWPSMQQEMMMHTPSGRIIMVPARNPMIQPVRVTPTRPRAQPDSEDYYGN